MLAHLPLDERLRQAEGFLDRLSAEHAPSGLVTPLGHEAVNSLAQIEMRPIDYLRIGSYCGFSRPPSYPKGTDHNQAKLLPAITEQYGPTSMFGLVGWLLKNSVHKMFVDAGQTKEGAIFYTNHNVVKCLDGALDSGLLAMGMMLEKVAATLGTTEDTIDQYVQAANRSLGPLVIPFARTPNRTNQKIEALYGIKKSGSYGSEDAAFELGLEATLNFGFAYDEGKDQVTPTNFPQTVANMPTPHPQCAAVGSRFFGKAWHHLVDATAALPELFKRASS